jgi:hypothetical protein
MLTPFEVALLVILLRVVYEMAKCVLQELLVIVGTYFLAQALMYVLVPIVMVVAAIGITVGALVYDLYRGVSAVVSFGSSIGQGICKGVLWREGREENNPLRC